MKAKAIVIALLLLAPALAFAAKEEYRLKDGDCEKGGTTWWVVSRYLNGRLIDMWGHDCNGNDWYKTNFRIVSTDPTIGEPITDTGVGDNGQPWYASAHLTAEGEITWAGGRDADGNYWEYGQRVVTGLD